MRQKDIELMMNVDENQIIKKATFWNFIASMLNAGTSAVLLFFITRLCGVNQAGMFSLASAIAYQCLSLGNFGVRNFQVSDHKKEFSFSDYLYFRIFSMILMFALLCYYAFANGYSYEKAFVVFTFGLFKCVDVIEDLYHGEYHRNNRLDIAAKLLTLRYVISLAVLIGFICVTKNLILSCIIATVATIFIFIYTNYNMIPLFFSGKYTYSFSAFKQLFICLLPIMVTNYIRLYITNAPKYAVDAFLTDQSQAYFGVLMMPVFVIGLLSDIIFRPYIAKLSKDWTEGQLKDFSRLIIRQILIIVGLTLFITVMGIFIGLKLLEIIYGMNLYQYMTSFILLLVSGGFTTLSGLLLLVMTVQREQKKMAFGYIITLVICLLISSNLVSGYGIFGSSFLCFVLSLIPAVYFAAISWLAYRKRKQIC